MVTHRGFEKWIQRVRMQIMPAIEKRDKTTIIVLFCNKGRHRSVAGSVFLAHCLNQEGVQCTSWHLSKPFWHRGTCEGKCDECCEASDVRTACLARAAQAWFKSRS